ncbi:H-NS histone family protein [Paraburkholderia tropica]|nr:H-NS histone family protein [Paraburkholderia tropica]
MATYRRLKAQIAELEEEAAVAWASEIAEVPAAVRAKVAEHGLTVHEVLGESPGGEGQTGVPTNRCRRNTGGATWSGRGRAPAGIANVKKREKSEPRSQGVARHLGGCLVFWAEEFEYCRRCVSGCSRQERIRRNSRSNCEREEQ